MKAKPKRHQILKNRNIKVKPPAGLPATPRLLCAFTESGSSFPPPEEAIPTSPPEKGENALFSLTTAGGNFFAPVLFGPAVFQS